MNSGSSDEQSYQITSSKNDWETMGLISIYMYENLYGRVMCYWILQLSWVHGSAQPHSAGLEENAKPTEIDN